MSAKKRGAITIVIYLIGGALAGMALVPYFAIPVPLIAGFAFIRLAQPKARDRAAIDAAILVGALAGVMIFVLLLFEKIFTSGEVRVIETEGAEFSRVFVPTLIANVAIGAVLGGMGGFLAAKLRGGQTPMDPPDSESPEATIPS
jgi:hypothetical protein